MNINVNYWINTRTYFIGKASSISFIEDVKGDVCYILKGKVSDLWSFIVSNDEYQKVKDFVLKNNIELDLNDFLAELQYVNLIKSDKVFVKTLNKHYLNKIDKNSKSYEYYDDLHSKFSMVNGFYEKIFLELNYSCNLKCKHCYNSKDCNEFAINFEQAKKIIDETYDLGLTTVVLTGGECTINKDFLKIARYIREKHLELGILTNGQKMFDDDVFFNNVVSLYPSLVKLSLYSMNPNIHDNITGVEGSHNKTLSVIKKLTECKINVKVVCPQLSYNFGSYKDVKNFTKSINQRYSTSCHFINNKENNNIEAKACSACIKQFYMDTVKQDSPVGKFTSDDNYICNAGINTLSFTPKLDVLPCVGVNYIFGNYNEKSLKELLKTTIDDFKQKFKRNNLLECHKHEYCKFCFYCLIHTCSDRGFLTKSEFLCEDAKIHYEVYLKMKENEK